MDMNFGGAFELEYCRMVDFSRMIKGIKHAFGVWALYYRQSYTLVLNSLNHRVGKPNMFLFDFSLWDEL